MLLEALDPQRALDQMFEEKQLRDVPDMDTLAADHIRLLTGIEDGTRLNYSRLWARTWGPKIGRIPATHLTRDDIAQATNVLASSYSAKSLKNQRGLLAGVCDRAVDLRYLPTNPTKRLRLPRAKETERTEMRILTLTEFEDVLSRVRAHYRPFLLFLAGMGCRYGEAVALQVQDVRLPDVHIRRALKWSPDNKRTVGPTKTRRSNRVVMAPPRVVASLAALIEDKPGDALVFTAPKGGPINHRTFWSDIWLPAVEHLAPRPRIHDLRHSHAAWQLADGVPVHVVSRRLGHESIKTTVDVYGGLLPDAQIAAAAAAGAVFGTGPLELD
jgi:integrase